MPRSSLLPEEHRARFVVEEIDYRGNDKNSLTVLDTPITQEGYDRALDRVIDAMKSGRAIQANIWIGFENQSVGIFSCKRYPAEDSNDFRCGCVESDSAGERTQNSLFGLDGVRRRKRKSRR